MTTSKGSPKEPPKDRDSTLWSGEVTATEHYHTPAGLFTRSAEEIAETIVNDSDSKRQAIARVTFYENRAGDNLDEEERERLDKAKVLIREAYDKKEE